MIPKEKATGCAKFAGLALAQSTSTNRRRATSGPFLFEPTPILASILYKIVGKWEL